MDEKTLINLKDAGCDEALTTEFDALPSSCARLMRLKAYRRELLDGIHAEQRKLECLDYLIYELRCEIEQDAAAASNKGERV